MGNLKRRVVVQISSVTVTGLTGVMSSGGMFYFPKKLVI